MKTFTFSTLAIAGLASSASATPILALKDLLCNGLKAVVNDLAAPAQAASASGFCSSYIASTTTVTNTITSIVGLTSQVNVPQTATTVVTAAAPVPTVINTIFANCGLKGYDKGSPAFHYDTANGTFAACSGLCAANAACQSFAYGSGACLLYNETTAVNFNAVATSPYTFNDKNCTAATQPSGTPSSGLPASTGVPASSLSSVSASRSSGAVVSPAATTTSSRGPVAARAIATPAALAKLEATAITQACECLITAASTVSKTVAQTAAITNNAVIYNNVIAGTVTSTVLTTPDAVTVTVTTTA